MFETSTIDPNEDNQNCYYYKIILIGDSTVGKTSLIIRFCDNKFHEAGTATVGIDTKSKTIKRNSKKIELEIWDTAGQERFKSLTKNSYQGADGIILVYDKSNKKSFQNIKIWYNNIKDSIDIEQTAILVVGNKCDIPDPEVSSEIAQKYCDDCKLEFIETSCKDNINVEDAFYKLVDVIVKLDSEEKRNDKMRRSRVEGGSSCKKKKKCCK